MEKDQKTKWRLRYKIVLVVFTSKRSSNRYIQQCVRRGFIRIPQPIIPVVEATLFLFDDVTPLGIAYPASLTELLTENNAPCVILNAQQLAEQLTQILPPTENIVALSGGGILAYLFLKKAGYQGTLKSVMEVERVYEKGKPRCTIFTTQIREPSLFFLDDIIASGQTLASILRPYWIDNIFNYWPDFNLQAACLMTSISVAKGEANFFNSPPGEKYRERKQATFPELAALYTAILVDGIFDNTRNTNKKPAILSLRYLLTKAIDKNDYTTGYLAKKCGGIERAKEICDTIRQIDREPIDLLRRDPQQFLKTYGVD